MAIERLNEHDRGPQSAFERAVRSRVRQRYLVDYKPYIVEPNRIDIEWDGGEEGEQATGRVILSNRYRQVAEYLLRRCATGEYRLYLPRAIPPLGK